MGAHKNRLAPYFFCCQNQDHRDNTNIPTCAVYGVDTAKNGYRPRIMAFEWAITVNDISELAVDLDYTAVIGLCQQQVFACMVYD